MAAGRDGVFLGPIDFPRSIVMSIEADKLSEKLCLLLLIIRSENSLKLGGNTVFRRWIC